MIKNGKTGCYAHQKCCRKERRCSPKAKPQWRKRNTCLLGGDHRLWIKSCFLLISQRNKHIFRKSLFFHCFWTWLKFHSALRIFNRFWTCCLLWHVFIRGFVINIYIGIMPSNYIPSRLQCRKYSTKSVFLGYYVSIWCNSTILNNPWNWDGIFFNTLRKKIDVIERCLLHLDLLSAHTQAAVRAAKVLDMM